MNRRATVFVLLVAPLACCARVAIAQAPRDLDLTLRSSVEIDSIKPGIATVLVPGNRTRFEVEVIYTLAAESGTMSLYVQNSEGRVVNFPSVEKRLTRGSGKVTLNADIEVPKTRKIDLIVALYDSVGRSTTITDGRVYEVLRP